MARKTSRSTFRSRLDVMVKSLRGDIIAGKRNPGDFLPSELALGEEFQLSKMSVRKGLDILVSEGFIEKVPRVGNRIVRPQTAPGAAIKFGYYPNLMRDAKLQTLIDRFHTRHPHIRVELIPIPYADDQPSAIEYFKRDMIDVATINYHHFQHVVADDRSMELLQPLPRSEEIYPFLQQPFMVDGAPRVLPLIFSPIVLCYNKDHFRDAGVPEPDSGWTWQDVADQSAKLSNGKDRYGFFYHLVSDNRWPIFLLQSGHVFRRNADNRLEFRNERVMEGLRIGRDLIRKQEPYPYLSENDSDAVRLFAQQKASMILASYFNLNALRHADFSFDIAPLPTFREPKTLLLLIGLAIHSRSPNKEAAAAFVRFLLSYESQLFIRQNTLSIPGLKKAAEWQGETSVPHPSRFHLFREIVPTFRLYTELNLSAEQLMRIRQELKLFWSQIDDLETVCRRLEDLL